MIEEASPCDAVALARLINSAYRVEDFFKAADRTTLDEVRQLLERETFLVAREADGSIAGCVRVAAEPPEGHFGMLAVDPGHRGAASGGGSSQRQRREHGRRAACGCRSRWPARARNCRPTTRGSATASRVRNRGPRRRCTS
ncbi:GNAT family N-acetyltransferase [Tepidiforma flava]|uniref:GNAT family N-acetyltransferase n=1 Tax=Tepidiforma flava TaxID=3004094 RepID=A0ABY7M671_9CHLR|nr:GNAT family N-acetyltransferase [Tepidiforma flava]WBL36008.1 GNAT family N-acetyltransferase [Tepidiforma flava]